MRSTLSRRELLGAFLSAPVVSAACRKDVPPPIAGSLLGQSDHVGHKLREYARGPWPKERTKLSVIVVGGGPSGLSAGWRLAKNGVKNYAIFDLEPRVGGTSQFGTDGVVPYPWGAHYIPIPRADNRALSTLLQEMGAIETGKDGRFVGKEELLIRAPEERVFHVGRWYEGLYLRVGASEGDLEELDRFQHAIDDLVRFRGADGRRAFSIPLETSTTDETIRALDRISMAAWLREKGFSSKRLLWMIDYACRDDYGLRLDQTSAYAGLFYYVARVDQPGEESADFLAWSNGNGALVEHLAKGQAERLHTDALVLDVNLTAQGVEALVLERASTPDAKLVAYEAPHAILAVPKFVAKRVVRQLRDVPMPYLTGSSFGSWMVANVHLSGRPFSRGFPLAWDNVFYDSPSLGYVVATHQALRDNGPTVFTYYYPLTDDDPARARQKLFSVSHHEWTDVVLAELGRGHPGIAPLVDRIDVWRWGHAMARPTPGRFFSAGRDEIKKPLGDRLWFAHADSSSIALFEEAQYWGVKAAEEILLRQSKLTDAMFLKG